MKKTREQLWEHRDKEAHQVENAFFDAKEKQKQFFYDEDGTIPAIFPILFGDMSKM